MGFGGLTTTVMAMMLGAGPAPPETALVVFSDRAAMDAGATEARALGGHVRRCFAAGRVCIFDFPSSAPWDELSAMTGVRSLEPDREMEGVQQAATFGDVAGTVDCDGFWELEALGIEAMWDQATGAQAPQVMVVDGGFLTSHEDLQGSFSGGWDYGNDDPVAEVEWDVGIPAHGTFIAGLLAATPDNGLGRVGLLAQGQVYAAKNSNSNGNFNYSYTIAALADAADDPQIRVVSYSLTSSSWSDSYAAAIEGLGESDVLIVAAAGNCQFAICPNANNDIFPKYPGNYPGEHVLQVGGTRVDGTWNSKSHYGVATVDFGAPGVSLCSLGVDHDGDTYTAAGTSYAAPLVAGVAALMMEAHPELSSLEVAEIMKLTAFRNAELATKVTFGRVDGAASVGMPWPELLEPVVPDTLPGLGTIGLPLNNRAGAGTLWLMVTHDANVAVEAPALTGWTAQAYETGSEVVLATGESWVAAQPTTIVQGPLERHFEGMIDLPLETIVPATVAAMTVQGIARSPLGHWVEVVPDSVVTTDASGARAWSFELVTQAATEPEPEPEPAPEPAPDQDPGHELVSAPDSETVSELGAEVTGSAEIPASDVTASSDSGTSGSPSVRDSSGCDGSGGSRPSAWLLALLLLFAMKRFGALRPKDSASSLV